MAKHAKPKQTLRNAKLTERGEFVVGLIGLFIFFFVAALMGGLE